jgi:hypothetical protein
MLGSVLVVSEVAPLPVITNSNQLILMLPAFVVSVAHPNFLSHYTASKPTSNHC